MKQLNKTQAPTTIFDLPGVKDSKANSVMGRASNYNSAMPFPYLEGLARLPDSRPGKRVVFDRSDFDNLLDQIVSQINDKRTKDFNEKVQRRTDEEQ
jgi:hypothetical protein